MFQVLRVVIYIFIYTYIYIFIFIFPVSRIDGCLLLQGNKGGKKKKK